MRRWLALVSFVATVTGSVAFVATEHLAPMLLVVLGLFVLVLVLGSEQYDTQRAKRQGLLPLDRLIADGRAILRADDEKSIVDWPDWVERAGGYLLKELGLQALYDFRGATDGYDPPGDGQGGLGRPRARLTFSSSRACLKAQLAELERLRRSLP
jgi:hypothetical protein